MPATPSYVVGDHIAMEAYYQIWARRAAFNDLPVIKRADFWRAFGYRPVSFWLGLGRIYGAPTTPRRRGLTPTTGSRWRDASLQ
jgi:hypothetical protein